VKTPAAKLFSAMLMLNAVFAGMVEKFGGFWNLPEGMWSTDGMTPRGAELHDPEVIWRPLVRGILSSVREQKLM
jgi:hypothetical protein